VGSESHRLHCQAKQSQGSRSLLLCQQPRVLQLPLLITTTGRVNRPEQATTLISSLINKTLPHQLLLLFCWSAALRTTSLLQKLSPTFNISSTTSFNFICLLTYPDPLYPSHDLLDQTNPNPGPAPTQPYPSQTIKHLHQIHKPLALPSYLPPLPPLLLSPFPHPQNNSPALLPFPSLPYPTILFYTTQTIPPLPQPTLPTPTIPTLT